MVVAMGAVNVVDWYLLLRATIKHDRELGRANQGNYGRSTYYMIFAQLVAIIAITAVVGLSGILKASFPVDNLMLTTAIFAVVYAVFKLVVALVQTLMNMLIIEVVSARYKHASRKELNK